MTRWIAGIVIAFCGLLPTIGLAQTPWDAPGVQQPGLPFQQQPAPGPAWHQQNSHVLYELLPDHHPQAVPPNVSEALSQSYLRFDYLFWKLSDYEDQFIGAPVLDPTVDLSGEDRLNRLQANDRLLGARQATIVVPSLGKLSMDNLNGFRGTFGLPTNVGVFEAEGFIIEESQQGIRREPFEDLAAVTFTTQIPAVTLLDNGVASNNTMILFSEGMSVRIATRLMGTEGNWIGKPAHPNTGLDISPIVGFRYMYLDENMLISGQDIPDPLNAPTTVLDHRLGSAAQNNVFGPQIGVKAAASWWKLSVGGEFKFLMGINRIRNRVWTDQIFAVDEEPQLSEDQNTRFAPTIDLSVYLRFHASENFTLFAGYDYILGGGYTRSANNIYYDAAASVNSPPNIRLNTSLETFSTQGLTVGGEFILW